MSDQQVLFISCWSLREPQCERLNLLPLRRLAASGFPVQLITFERGTYGGTPADRHRWREELRGQNISWTPVTYHHRPLLLAKAWDTACAVVAGWQLVRRHRVRLIHARSEQPALVAWLLKRLTGVPVLYESDAPISEERVDTGTWRQGGLLHRLVGFVERRLVESSDELVVLTHPYAQRLRELGATRPISVIPSCTDVESIFRDEQARHQIRSERGWLDQLVLVYSGSVGGWYQLDQMAAFVAYVLDQTTLPVHWLCLINERPDYAAERIAAAGVPADAHTILTVTPEQVPAWLSAADVALAFIRPGNSKYASSPTKTAEYLACGLPILLTSGVGDTAELAADPLAGHVLDGEGTAGFPEASRWLEWVATRLPEAVEACRAAATRHLSVQETSVPAYREIYARLTAVTAR